MLGGDGVARRAGGLGIFDLLRFAFAEGESVRVARFGAEDVEAPGIGDAVVRGQRRQLQQSLDLGASRSALGEFADGTA